MTAGEGEEVAVRGREVYCWHGGGIQRSPLAVSIGKADASGTARNWNTVLKLNDLL